MITQEQSEKIRDVLRRRETSADAAREIIDALRKDVGDEIKKQMLKAVYLRAHDEIVCARYSRDAITEAVMALVVRAVRLGGGVA